MAKQATGRPRKYKTAKALQEAINDYFDAITKKNGEWKKPPSVAGLCLKLGITRQTLINYATGDDQAMAFVAQSAKLVIEDFWSSQLAGKFANGAKFALGSGFGWSRSCEAMGIWVAMAEREREETEAGVVEIAKVEGDNDG